MDRVQEELDPTFVPLSGIPPDQKSAWLFPSKHGEPTRRMEARFSDPAQLAVFQQLAQLRQAGNQSMADHWSARRAKDTGLLWTWCVPAFAV